MEYTVRFFYVFSLQGECAGDVSGALYLFGDEFMAVTSFEKVCGKFSGASLKSFVC